MFSYCYSSDLYLFHHSISTPDNNKWYNTDNTEDNARLNTNTFTPSKKLPNISLQLKDKIRPLSQLRPASYNPYSLSTNSPFRTQIFIERHTMVAIYKQTGRPWRLVVQ